MDRCSGVESIPNNEKRKKQETDSEATAAQDRRFDRENERRYAGCVFLGSRGFRALKVCGELGAGFLRV